MLPDNHTSSTRNRNMLVAPRKSHQQSVLPTAVASPPSMCSTHLQLPTNILLLRLMRWRRRCRPAFLRRSAPFCCCCCFCQATALCCMLRQLL